MVVERDSFNGVLRKLRCAEKLSLDTETTGLFPYRGDRLFSIIISDAHGPYYFNFQDCSDIPRAAILSKENLKAIAPLLEDPLRLWFLHNAKFDMHMLAQEGLTLAGKIHCTQITGRLIENNLDFDSGYSLEALAAKIGLEKSSAVETYVDENKLFTKVEISGKEFKKKHFDQVPWKIIVPYAERDAEITYALGLHQLEKIRQLDVTTPTGKRTLSEVYDHECDLVKVVFDMERVGIKIDRGYCLRAANHEAEVTEAEIKKFKEATGVDFVDSGKCLSGIFDKFNLPYPMTEKGNPSFKKEVIEDLKHPIARQILKIRESSKRGTTYFHNYIRFADKKNFLHANLNQAGTETGRFSASNPNLQNIPKRGDVGAEFPVKGAFIAEKDFCLVAMDYAQMEYRMMLDYAGEMEMIEKVKNGYDVHDATVEMMRPFAADITRDFAKTLNFMILYGGGTPKVALKLFDTRHVEAPLKEIFYLTWYKGWTPENLMEKFDFKEEHLLHDLGELRKAHKLRSSYFAALPKVEAFIEGVKKRAEKRGFIRTWAGSRLLYASGWHYKAPNGLIQGGCAQVVKRAMIASHSLLQGLKSKLLLQVHDELLFKIHKSELEVVPALRGIMVDAYPHTHLPMDVSVDHSWTSWGAKVKGLPTLDRVEYGKG